MEFPVSKMNRMLTNKVGTAKRKKLRELQVTKIADIYIYIYRVNTFHLSEEAGQIGSI